MSNIGRRIRFALPKGSLEAETLAFLDEAGYRLEGVGRSYKPEVNDPEIEVRILRPQEIPQLVEEGSYDLGITGIDWVMETEADVEVLEDLRYGRVDLVLAVPKDWDEVNSFGDLLRYALSSRGCLTIYTEYLNLAAKWIAGRSEYRERFGESPPMRITPWMRCGENPAVRIYLSFGATEAKPPEIADAIIDVTRTGATLEANNLKVIEKISTSTAHLIANRGSMRDPWKREKILDVATLLRGVVEARGKLHIFVNVREENLDKILPILPALRAPTISPLARKGWYALNTVIGEDEFLKILPTLRRYAEGLVVYRPRQVLKLREEGDEHEPD